jgi:DNA-binding MarR family transcriptional regulator
MGLRRNSVSELLQRLEAKGLVARIRDERDERRVLVWLTDAGRDVVARVGEVLAPDALEQAMAALAPDERSAVIRGFELLVALEPAKPAALPPAESNREPVPERNGERTHR